VLVNQDGLLDPINCEYSKYIRTSDIINWSDGRIGTDNVFTINATPISSEQHVDLTDMKTFPPMEFFYDLKNLLEIFIEFNSFSEKQVMKLKSLKRKTFPYDSNAAIFLRADMMLDYLYEKPIGETFHLTT
jgi:hypothetical protein